MSRVEPKDRPSERASQPRGQQQVDDRHPSKAEGEEKDVEQALQNRKPETRS